MHALIALGIFVVVFLLVVGLIPDRGREERIRHRLQRYSDTNVGVTDELALPFGRRVVLPLIDQLGHLAAKGAPTEIRDRVQERLERAGSPASLTTYLALSSLIVVIPPLAYLAALVSTGGRMGLQQAMVFLLLVLIGLYLPTHWLTRKVESRQHALQRALPDALDLMVVSMEAGLSLDGAISRVVEKGKGPLQEELRRTLREIRLGAPRREAFRHAGMRTGVRELMNFFNAVIQADQMGVGLGQVMRVHADEARLRRGQKAEERAHQASVKMLFPLIFLILPSMLIVTAGPAVVALVQLFSAGLRH